MKIQNGEVKSYHEDVSTDDFSTSKLIDAAETCCEAVLSTRTINEEQEDEFKNFRKCVKILVFDKLMQFASCDGHDRRVELYRKYIENLYKLNTVAQFKEFLLGCPQKRLKYRALPTPIARRKLRAKTFEKIPKRKSIRSMSVKM